MKRRESRVLTFAVTGALLGGAGTGCHHHYRGPYVNPGPDERPPASPEDPEPDAAAPDPAPEPDAPEPDAPDSVNEGPVDEPPAAEAPPRVMVNPVKQPDPAPAPEELEPGTNNVRKVDPPAKPRSRTDR
jgi:hypothetical protein